MRAYEKRFKRIALVITLLVLTLQVVNQYFSFKALTFKMNLIFALIAGIAAFAVMEVAPSVFIRMKAFCGVFHVTYEQPFDGQCSVILIDFHSQQYTISVYDYKNESGQWINKNNAAPINMEDIFYEYRPKKIHMISSDNECTHCIFLQFLNGMTRQANLIRFEKSDRMMGTLRKLEKADLCTVFNNDFNNTEFCDKRISKAKDCAGYKRQKCRRSYVRMFKLVKAMNIEKYKDVASVMCDCQSGINVNESNTSNCNIRANTDRAISIEQISLSDRSKGEENGWYD